VGSPPASGWGALKLAFALVCEDARLDPAGRLDIRGVLHDLHAPGFPARQDRMVLVLVLEWDPGDQGRFSFKVDLLGPDQRPTLTVDGHTDVAPRPDGEAPPRTRLIMPLEGVVFPAPGGYSLRVRVKGRTLDGATLHLLEGDGSVQGTGDAGHG